MFIPKKSKILWKLAEQSEVVEEGAGVLREVMADLQQLEKACARLEILESKGDEFVHEITDEVEIFFILPLDKEDIKELTERLDDMLDGIEQVANRFYLYNLSERNESAKKFSELILESAQQIRQGILLIKDHKFQTEDFSAICKRIHTLENQGDKLHRKILGDMMSEVTANFGQDGPFSLINLIKWKEIFQMLEDILDVCEDIAVVFGKLRIKYK
ncbi:MAG: DUF47 family protein [Clostridiales bacterium]|nr:DUF47 family protein [Clostridiales bacterium]